MVPALSSTFSATLHDLRHRIDEALNQYSDFGRGCPEELREAIRHSLLAPGKRLRPMLVLMAAEACGCDQQRAVPAACAVEMIHTYSLIHDDLPAMDDDDMRRGQPSCHAKFGEATAILAGDALLTRAFEIMAQDIQPPQVAARCCAELAHAAGVTQLVGGQADDLAAQFADGSVQRLEDIHRRKTGAMFWISLRLGGIVAEADDEQADALGTYGRKMGLAFQIVDDLLDLQGDETAMGKRTKKDHRRGKLTFPAVLGVEESRHRAERLIDEACHALAPFGSRADDLAALARYVIQRNH